MRDAESRHAIPGRSVGSFALLGLLAFGLALLASGSAGAATIHVPGPTFDLQSLGSAQAGSIAVDDQTGSVYVMASANSEQAGNIEKFDASGNKSNFSGLGTNVIDTPCGYQCMQIAVDNSGGPHQGTIYVSTTGSLTNCCPTKPNETEGGVEVYLPSGAPAGVSFTRSQFEYGVRACGVAVDGDGNLIVTHGEYSTGFTYIDELTPGNWGAKPFADATLEGSISSDAPQVCRTAVDSAGAVYVTGGMSPYSYEAGPVRRFPAGSFAPETNPNGGEVPASTISHSTFVDHGPDIGVATDGEDDVYALRGESSGGIRKYDSSGSLIESFGAGELESPGNSGIAVDKSTGVVYATDGGNGGGVSAVHTYLPVTVPDSLTGEYSASTQTSGELGGEVDPAGAGDVTSCEFEYVESEKYEESEFEEGTDVPCAQATPISATAPVTAPVSGLNLETRYSFRLVSADANGTSVGTVHSFVSHAVIGLSTEPATEVAPRSAELNASFVGNGDGTEYSFQYGKTATYGSETPRESAGSPNGATEVSEALSGLELETTYHYRVVGVNGTGTSYGEDRTFKTAPAVAGVMTKPATEVGQGSITLNGEFTGNGDDTHYYFEYGPTTLYGTRGEEADAGPASGVTPVSTQITEFSGYTTYHYRLVASNSLGVTYGPDRTVTSPDAPLPVISGTASSNVTPTTVELSASINPNRWTTAYQFEWGPSTEYGTSTEISQVLPGLGNESLPVSAEISGLEPGRVYHYRAIAVNFTGVTYGPDMTFTTPDVPTIESISISAITQTSAHVSVGVAANDSPTSVTFESGTSTSYGSATAPQAIGSALLAREVEGDLTGLTPGTTYHVRASASNGIGTATGGDFTFTTRAATPGPPEKSKPKPCPKGKVRRKGRCVKKPHHHRRHKHRRNGHGNG